MNRTPNLVYILADDMGYGDVSCLNEHCAFTTPHLDQIAQNGVVFTDAHATSAVCTPSRYGILTGRYNWRSRLKSHVLGGYSPALIEQGRMTVADLLRQADYRTAAIGKWHLGMNFATEPGFGEAADFAASPGVDYSAPIARSPITNGFDYFYGISGSLDMPPYVYIENDRFTALPTHNTQGRGRGFWRKGPTAPNFKHEEVLDHLTQKATQYIENNKDHRFFLYFALPAPHTPILPGPKYRGKSGVGDYGDFVLQCDGVVGQITQSLRQAGILDNTILIFTSDNGCSPMADFAHLAAHGHNPSYHFRGHKADIYEGGHRVPFLIQWPERMGAGQVCEQTTCLSDLMATMSDLVGVALPDNAGEDSVSMLPLWLYPDGTPLRQDVVHQSIDGSLALRQGSYKLEMCPGSGGWSYPAPGEELPSAPQYQLFDLSQDIGEVVNIINQHPQLFAQMRDTLRSYVLEGRSTPGPPQPNTGSDSWPAAQWVHRQSACEGCG